MHYVFSFQVKDCVKELGKLLYPLLIHRQSKVSLNFGPNFQISRLSFLQHQLQHFLEGRSGDLLVQLQDHQQLQWAVVEPARDDDLELGDERGRAAVDQYKRAGPCNQGAPTIAF